jgi:hypothetical protein
VTPTRTTGVRLLTARFSRVRAAATGRQRKKLCVPAAVVESRETLGGCSTGLARRERIGRALRRVLRATGLPLSSARSGSGSERGVEESTAA